MSYDRRWEHRPWWQRPLSQWITKSDLGRMLQHVGEDVYGAREVQLNKANGVEILKEIKALRDELLKPVILFDVGKAKDKET